MKQEPELTQTRDKGKGKAKQIYTSDDGGGETPEPSRSDVHSDADSDGDVDSPLSDGEEGTPKGHKRARRNAGGDSIPSAPSQSTPRERVKTLPRDDDGFIPGSIVRIQLCNFVTYDWVEFRPGPYLNMILGPNGTGKSSIACAIALGLNWSPHVLGRANELNSFVKNDKQNGYIEIELKGAKRQKNLVIRRNLSAKSKGSTFTLNGAPSTGKEITKHMLKLNVQVGNLCSFLPQDKVSEFAQMSPQQLLKETQRAAGDPSLATWHDTLIESGKQHKALQELITSEQDQLATMKDRNAQLERDVARYQERKRIEKEISVLEVLIPVNEYHEAKERYTKAKERQRELHARVTRLKDRNAPAHAKLQQLGNQYKEQEKVREKKKNASKHKFQQMKTKWADSEQLENDAEDVATKLDGLKSREKDRLKKIKDLQAQLARWEREVEDPPAMEDVRVINEELRQLNAEHNQTRNRMEDLQERQKANVESSAVEKAKIADAHEQLQKLDDERHRKLERLRQQDRDCAEAVAWLRNNQDRFKMEVFEPPMICCSVSDKKYTNAVEACFSKTQLKTLVAQCEEDYELLNRCLNDSAEAGLRRDAKVNTWYRPKTERSLMGAPAPLEEMRSLGFDAYAIDKIDCADGLLWYLKREVNMHRTAIGLDGSKVDIAGAMEVVSRLGPRGEGGGATFIAGNVINTVQRSRYGKRAAQNMTRDVPLAQSLVSSTIDPEVKRRLDQVIQEARQALENTNEDASRLAAEERTIRGEEAQFKKNFEALEERKRKVNEMKNHLVTLGAKIRSHKTKLAGLANAPTVDDERARLKQRLLELSKERTRVANEYTQLIRAAISDQHAATRSGIEVLQVGANKNALETLCREKDERYQRALAEFEQADRIFVAAKADAKNRRDISVELVRKMDREFQEQFAKMELDGSVHDRTVEELRAELEVQKANLDMIMQTNPGVMEQYERRKTEIEGLSARLEDREQRCRKLEHDMKKALDEWRPALERLVTSIGKKFSAAFDRIGCAGEIRISGDDDYDKWAIDILVKFRDKEKLTLLTGQRQSGGERSLTTILYLMSLTEEARTPFSLVDEINQGMDQRAERAVHNSMVEVTCRPDSGQYFLITPKLLPDLRYHERMKILCVNNGEWLPEEKGLGNMMKMIDTFVQTRDRSSRAE